MGGGYDRVGAHMGILGDKAADVVAKNAAEKVKTLADHEKWISEGVYGSGRKVRRGGIWRKVRTVIGRVMEWRRRAVTNYCRLRGGKGIGRWWEKKIGGQRRKMWRGRANSRPHSVLVYTGRSEE